ncbi:hypothetical protein CIG75_07320 [Tumebacillus algifaecis]|uniref:DUF5590 domain-containing protein n=1 Tax=Tumebacillus algifaecis TaxID=1214604 RepID=A0A223D0E3_9BACL|nr:hypothetical protein [Tumebacillus algifaecis]ASS74806.1 hypothetical protein CIG75_07320 [Tumebacillus algifaecis]
MKRKFWLFLSLLLLPWFVNGCEISKEDVPQQQKQVTGPVVPLAEEGRKFAIDEKLMSDVEETQIVYTRFQKYGPQYLMVRGVDTDGREKIIWLSGNTSTGIRVVSETYIETFLTESRIREMVKDQGEIVDLFLAPNDRVEGKGKNQPIWYVEFGNGHVTYLNPETGEQLK